MPAAEIRRYVAAWSSAAAEAPNTSQMGAANTATRRRSRRRGHSEPIPSLPWPAPRTVTGAELTGDDAGGAVGEEHEHACCRAECRSGDTKAGQRDGAEVTDDGRVGEQEHRLGDQGEERRDRQPQDLPVGAAAIPARVRAGCCGADLGAPVGTSRGGAYGWVVSSSQEMTIAECPPDSVVGENLWVSLAPRGLVDLSAGKSEFAGHGVRLLPDNFCAQARSNVSAGQSLITRVRSRVIHRGLPILCTGPRRVVHGLTELSTAPCR